MIQYYINYTKEGQILGFTKGDTDLNIEVSNDEWVEGQSYNKIIIDGDNISFEKVDWRTPKEIEEQRISSIKSKAEQLITSKYSIIWQLNHPRLDEAYKDDYAYIDRIRDISNEAETNRTALEDIDWNKDV